MTAFVSFYRCGAVRGFHSIPFLQKYEMYILFHHFSILKMNQDTVAILANMEDILYSI